MSIKLDFPILYYIFLYRDAGQKNIKNTDLLLCVCVTTLLLFGNSLYMP